MQIEEVHQGLGSWKLDLDWDPALDELVDFYNHVRVSWFGTPIYLGVLLKHRKSRTVGIHAEGRQADWWLGLDDRGPVIRERRYYAGNDKLSDGSFAFDDLYWQFADPTEWTIAPGVGYAIQDAITPRPPALERRDPLTSLEQIPVLPGETYRAAGRALRFAGAAGRLLLRPVITGRFVAAERAPSLDSGGWTDISADPLVMDIIDDPDHPGTDAVVIRIHPRPNLLTNPGFEAVGDATHVAANWLWNFTDVAANFQRVAGVGRTGSYGLTLHFPHTEPVAGQKFTSIEADNVPVDDGEQYCVGVYTRGSTSRSGGGVKLLVAFIGTSPADPPRYCDPSAPETVDDVASSSDADPKLDVWELLEFSVTAPKGATEATVLIQGHDNAGGNLYLDDAFMVRHNTDWTILESDPIDVEAGRGYTHAWQVRRDEDTVGGEIFARVVPLPTPDDDKVFDSPHLTEIPEPGTPVALTVGFTVPDGVTQVKLQLCARNVQDGAWYARNPTLKTTDLDTAEDVDTTLIWPAATGGAYIEKTRDIVIPDGAENLHLEWAAETGDGGWQTTGALVRRVAVTYSTVQDVVRDLLLHPDTGLPLLTAGAIDAPETIAYDYTIRNQTNRTVLKHLLQTLATPPKEYRIRPDGTLDVDIPESLFTVRELVLFPQDANLLDDPSAEFEHDSEDFVTRVVLLGADRRLGDGRTAAIESSADNPTLGYTNLQGDPIAFTYVEEDGQVDHIGFAAARARYDADRLAEPAPVLPLRLADWRAVALFDVGDWIQAWLPDAGLEDLTNPVTIDGRTGYPIQQRVLSRRWTLGSPGAFTVELRGDGAWIDVSKFVRWPPATQADLEVGVLRREFATDPQGGAVGPQFVRFRSFGK